MSCLVLVIVNKSDRPAMLFKQRANWENLFTKLTSTVTDSEVMLSGLITDTIFVFVCDEKHRSTKQLRATWRLYCYRCERLRANYGAKKTFLFGCICPRRRDACVVIVRFLSAGWPHEWSQRLTARACVAGSHGYESLVDKLLCVEQNRKDGKAISWASGYTPGDLPTHTPWR